MTEKARRVWGGVFCALTFLTCLGVAWPVAKMSFDDDWSYIKTAEVFARTGHIVYNGWSVEPLGWMAAWGAVFIKLFGFSFMAVKLSSLPLAVATLLLFYAVLIRFEITPGNAVIGTLTLGLSPVFMPLSASFMTDIPGLFAIVLCLYCCQRAVRAGSDGAAMAWLAVAAATNVVGGTARQVAWLGVLVMVPCTGWLLRERRKVLAAAVGLWLAGIGAVVYCMHWFAQQPYSVKMAILPKPANSVVMGALNTLYTADMMGAEVLFLLLAVFPVLVAWLPKFGKKADHYILLFCIGVLPLTMMKLMFRKYAEVWPPELLMKELSTRRDASIAFTLDRHRALIPYWGQALISLVVLAAALGLLFAVKQKGWKTVAAGKERLAREMVWLLAPFTLGYFALLLTLGWHWIVFDRYLLGVMPCAIVAGIWLSQRCVGPRLPRSSVVMLVVFAVFSVAGTHDLFAWQRARLAAIHELRQAGIPRTEIAGGFEYDGWTQIEDGAYVNDPRIKVPRGAFKGPRPKPDIHDPCAADDAILPELTDIHPQYSIGIGLRDCYLPSSFPAVRYTSWIPPFRRTIEIQRVPKKRK